ncbi:hypothetical protein ACGLWX_05840 [Halomonas sp. HMF6819]|uniref:hypothetical protein n=1 Tax=Halomonas sp. HMF6819 TaxID=3373085 RepID=UPI00378C1FD2
MRARGHYVEPAPQPGYDPQTQEVQQGQLEQDTDGNWHQTWSVRDLTQEEIDARNHVPVPASITPRQARLELLNEGLLSQVDAAINSLDSPDKERAAIEWEFAEVIERDSPWINDIGEALGLTQEQIDEMFIAAAQI